MNIPDNILIPFLIFINIYTAINFGVFWGFLSLKSKRKNSKKTNSFSIVIPARNEAKNIPHLLDSLLAQNYDKNLFEIIIIDDFSEDDTLSILEEYEKKGNIQILKNQKTGKKAALQMAWQHSQNEYIIQIDADCSVKPQYLTSINTYLQENKCVKLLLAPVLLKYKLSHFWSAIQALEFSSLIVSTAGFAYYKNAIMANGANLIYPKNILHQLDTKLENKTPSGDDMFLLQEVKNKWGGKAVHYLKSEEAVVYTHASQSLKDFWQQRIRWASKGKYLKDKLSLFIGAYVFLFNFSILTLFVLSFFSAQAGVLLALIFLLKFLSDFIVLLPFLHFHKSKKLLIYYPILSILYIFYVSFVGIAAPFSSYRWKNRAY